MLKLLHGNPHFSTFSPEMWHVCSYLHTKPNSRCWRSKFLLIWSLLTVFNGIHIFQSLHLKFGMCVYTCIREAVGTGGVSAADCKLHNWNNLAVSHDNWNAEFVHMETRPPVPMKSASQAI